MDDVYEVDCILKARGHGKAQQLLVKWVGYDETDSTWEPLKNIHPTLVAEFQATAAKKRSIYDDITANDEDDEDDEDGAEQDEGDDNGDDFWEAWVPPEKKANDTPSATKKKVYVKPTRVLAGKAAERSEAAAKRKINTKAVSGKAAAKATPAGEATPAKGKGIKRTRAPREVMTTEEAQRRADNEGLQLVPSARQSKSGYVGVMFHGLHSCAVKAQWCTGNREVYLGSFSGVPEAALAVARHLGPELSGREAAKQAAKKLAAEQATALAPNGITEEEAWRLARAEGLELVTSTNKTGYKNVSIVGRSVEVGCGNSNADAEQWAAEAVGKRRPFLVYITKKLSPEEESRCGFIAGGRCFRTVGEAALAYARYLGPAFFDGREEREKKEAERRERRAQERAQEEEVRQERAASRAVILQAKAEAMAAKEVAGVVKWLVRETERTDEMERAVVSKAAFRKAMAARREDEEIAKVVRKVMNFLKLRTVRTAEAEAEAEAKEVVARAKKVAAEKARARAGVARAKKAREAAALAEAKVGEARAAEVGVKAAEASREAAAKAAKQTEEARPGYVTAKQARTVEIAASEANEKAARASRAEELQLRAERKADARSSIAPDPIMSLKEANKLAQAEGLALVASRSALLGYEGVGFYKQGRKKPYVATMGSGHGKGRYIGAFSGIPEAALAYARRLGPAASTAAAAAAAAADVIAEDATTIDPYAAAVAAAAAETGARVAAVRSGLHGASLSAPVAALPRPPELSQPRQAKRAVRPEEMAEMASGRSRKARVAPSSSGATSAATSAGSRRATMPSSASSEAMQPASPPSTAPSGLWKARPSAAVDPQPFAQIRLGPSYQASVPAWTAPRRGVASARGPLARRAERERLSMTDTAALRHPCLHWSHADIARAAARGVASLLTATAFGPLGPLTFVAPCDCDLGLFARVALKAGQFLSEYRGPRLPTRLQVRGQYVLQVPATSFVIDGAGENSPFEVERSPAIYANHSREPNARIESWPALRPGPLEVRQHMMLVATEPIDAGQEIRINYEGGDDASYWDALGHTPSESTWRQVRVDPPPAANEEPVFNRLQELQAAVEVRSEAPPCHVPAVCSPIPWGGASGGDARLHAIVPLLSANARDINHSAWPLVSTHVPGRSGRECRDRWLVVQDIDEHSGWLQTPATEAVSHAEAAAGMAAAHRAAAAAAAATTRDESSDDGDDESVSPRHERCCISGCKRQLLTCFGQKRGGGALGCAEDGHHICAPCLYQWLASETSLRAEQGLNPQSRRTCPVCKSELRAAAREVRSDADKYVMGLLKVERTWSSAYQ